MDEQKKATIAVAFWTAVFFLVLYGVWAAVSGKAPSVEYLRVIPGSGHVWKLPFPITRWLDVVFGPAYSGLLVYLISSPWFQNLNPQGPGGMEPDVFCFGGVFIGFVLGLTSGLWWAAPGIGLLLVASTVSFWWSQGTALIHVLVFCFAFGIARGMFLGALLALAVIALLLLALFGAYGTYRLFRKLEALEIWDNIRT